MAAPKRRKEDPVQIDAREDRLVVLTPDNEDRFIRDCDWVVRAAEMGLSRDLIIHELHAMFSHTRQWMEQRADRVEACLATLRDGQVAIFVVPRSEHYDVELSDGLTALDFELAAKFRACPCDVLQIPKQAERIRRSEVAVLIYGDPERASRQMVAQS